MTKNKLIMKRIILLLCCMVLFYACKNDKTQNTEKPNDTITQQNDSAFTDKDFKVDDFTTYKNETLKNWKDYYKNMDADFSLEKFEEENHADIDTIPASIKATYDADFDSIYQDFLIYNSDNRKYIDIDSYKWQKSSSSDELMFNPDQEIAVINEEDKTKTRIAFRGPSYQVEDAFWKNDSLVVLLENSDEKIPIINLINLNTLKNTTYYYQDTLAQESEYYKERLEK